MYKWRIIYCVLIGLMVRTKNKCVACTQNNGCYGRARGDSCGTAGGTCQLESQNTRCLYCDEPSTTCPITPRDDGNGNVLAPDAECYIPGGFNNILSECKMDDVHNVLIVLIHVIILFHNIIHVHKMVNVVITYVQILEMYI
eukprot:74089_1